MSYVGNLVLFARVYASLTGCLGHYEAKALDLEQLQKDSIQLFAHQVGLVDKESWPRSIKALSPEQVIRTQTGLRIRLKRFWVEEHGLYIPFDNLKPPEGGDPSYRELGRHIYSYHVSG